MSDDSRRPVKRALVSVYDKTGLEELARGLALAGGDVVEVVPELDSSHLTSTVAATIAYEVLSLMACSTGASE